MHGESPSSIQGALPRRLWNEEGATTPKFFSFHLTTRRGKASKRTSAQKGCSGLKLSSVTGSACGRLK